MDVQKNEQPGTQRYLSPSIINPCSESPTKSRGAMMRELGCNPVDASPDGSESPSSSAKKSPKSRKKPRSPNKENENVSEPMFNIDLIATKKNAHADSLPSSTANDTRRRRSRGERNQMTSTRGQSTHGGKQKNS